MRIYVTDGNNRATLAITRSLGSKGHQIYVGEKFPTSLAGKSKFCYKALKYPDPSNEPGDFVTELIEQIHRHNIDIVIPVADITSFLIIEHKNRLPNNCKLPFAEYTLLQQAADKKSLVDTAENLDVPIPKTVVIETKDKFSKTIIDIPFPVVIKPARSRVKTNNGWVFTAVSYANNKDELLEEINNKLQEEFPILLQERINGPGIGIFMCFNKGTPIAHFSHERLREKPPSGGVSVLRQSIPCDPKALHYATKLLKHINWHGVAMVEFKIDTRDNTPKLMEINGRFWGSLQLAIDAGVDFPYLLIRTLDEKPPDPVANYKIGVKSRWLLGDLDLLLLILFKPRSTLNLPLNYPGKLSALIRFLNFWEKNQRLEVLRLSDIMPFFHELKKWLRIS